ncbi:MAG TPA: bifunctional 2-polyprenyl-6-hydroxyphenol methylase/3-demethylubiquinol 3-O-methyltransferase UbiG [Gammaproteobacteria bacterium]|nr:bifunctional 2-polyprenyl-6-hydroxyphenol methylase/3-demethylubiquinol 3-O-methyltransferase UbiG [Gammaproteobacteria bacterium]
MARLSNVDQGEVGKFDQLASRWWDPKSEFRPLHEINPLRLEWINKLAPLAGKEVIDIGCGGGILSESMAALGADVTGIDMAPTPLQVAKLHLKETGLQVDYQQITAEHMAEEHAGEFDVVTCMEMLEHVPDPASVVKACAQLVKPGGMVFLSTINRNPKSFAMAIVGAEYILKLLPKGTHEYAKFIRPSELANWCRSAGLETGDMTGIHYNPLTQRYTLGPGVDVNYLLSCQG